MGNTVSILILAFGSEQHCTWASCYVHASYILICFILCGPLSWSNTMFWHQKVSSLSCLLCTWANRNWGYLMPFCRAALKSNTELITFLCWDWVLWNKEIFILLFFYQTYFQSRIPSFLEEKKKKRQQAASRGSVEWFLHWCLKNKKIIFQTFTWLQVIWNIIVYLF